jgi:GNAT superfamily N-acetyltransferase
MWWRLPRSVFNRQKGEENRAAMQAIVASGEIPGILAYQGGEPVGWCSIGPRDKFEGLERTRGLKRVDDSPVWSVVCFYIAKPYRRKGISRELLKAALSFAREHGAKIVEGYPVEPHKDSTPDPFVWTGLPGTFLDTGFTEVLRRSSTRPIMRFYLDEM